MANHKSALKRHRQEIDRRQRNRNHRTRMRSAVKKLRQALETGDAESAQKLLPATLAVLDHTAKLGAIHDKAAARTKSRLARALNRLSA